jgi:hypothetical protein
LIRVSEVYFCEPGKPDVGTKPETSDIVKAIQEYKIKRGWRWRDPVSAKRKDCCNHGLADSAIFDQHNEFCPATAMQEPVKINGDIHTGIDWTPADKSGTHSRRIGFQLFRDRLLATAKFPREQVGLFVCEKYCPDFMRTIPTLQRDEKDRDDVDSKQEDHIYDECR